MICNQQVSIVFNDTSNHTLATAVAGKAIVPGTFTIINTSTSSIEYNITDGLGNYWAAVIVGPGGSIGFSLSNSRIPFANGNMVVFSGTAGQSRVTCSYGVVSDFNQP